MASYENFYGGGDSVFSPGYGNLTGYELHASMLGFPGSPQSANQVQDVVNAIKHGTKVFEVTMLQPDVAESIPIQHFDEMRALMKLTGVKPSVHAPVIDSVGFGEQGWGKEQGRADNERRMFDAIVKAQRIDPTGKLPIVFHSTNGTPGLTYRPGDKKGERVLESGAVINQDTGQVQVAKREEKWRPQSFDKRRGDDYGKPILFSAESSVDSLNAGEWEGKLTEVAQMSKHAEELIGSAPMFLAEYKNGVVVGQDGNGLKVREFTKEGKLGVELPSIKSGTAQADQYEKMRKASLFLGNAELSFNGAFEKAYKYGSDEQRKELKKLGQDYSKAIGGLPEDLIFSPQDRRRVLDNSLERLRSITGDKYEKVNGKTERIRGTPQIWKSSEELALEEASKTFGNLAIKSYDEFKEKAPILAIENAYPTQALSNADSMKKLIERSRERMVEGLVNNGVSKNKAKKLAKEKIGVTWDVGHLNMVKKSGFDDEEVLRQTKLISKDKSMVKHIHLTDNFGHADTHLVPGMGNVPTKKILEELEKTGRLDEMRKITEAGGIVQHFRKLPHSMTLAAMGSPIYGMQSAGAWNQAVEMQGSYFGGYGTLNPQTHHSYFGAGFTNMPVELGGMMAGGGGSRFGGTPMA